MRPVGNHSRGREIAGLKETVAARDVTVKRLEDEVLKAKADVVVVVNTSGSEREKVLAAQDQESSETVLSLEKELEPDVANLDGAMKQGDEAQMAVDRAESVEKEAASLREQLEGKTPLPPSHNSIPTPTPLLS